MQASNAGSGVIQLVHQVNPLGLSTHIQRVSTALPKDGKYTLMRGVDATQLFLYCPAETPEGHGAGLLQNLALFARVRLGTETAHVVSALNSGVTHFASSVCGVHGLSLAPITRLEQTTIAGQTLVLVNGEPVAYTTTPEALVTVLRRARRAKVLPLDASVIVAPHGIAIFTDMGTVQFPLICLDSLQRDGHKLATGAGTTGELFKTMLGLGIIEYVEAWEALDYRVAFKPEDLKRVDLTVGLNGAPLMPFTHMALHPMAILGTSASSVPWSDHDQAPRVSYQAGECHMAVDGRPKASTSKIRP